VKRRPRFPLMAKVAVWLAVHLSVLAGAFAVFVGWQLQLGLDSLLSGAAGERLDSLGAEISTDLGKAAPGEWDGIVAKRIAPYGLDGFMRMERELGPGNEETDIPEEIISRAKKELPPPGNARTRPPEPPPGRDGERHPPGPEPDEFRADRREPGQGGKPGALFLTRGQSDGAYWAALDLSIESPGPGRARHGVLFLRSDNASANGLFFDYKPWLYGGLAVLALSIALWAPFVLGITRYAGRISKATERIAEGCFDTKLGATRNDELGRAGDSIEEMSARLGQLISGQRRFLGDVAHELCAPLARMRTGLGILGNAVDERQSQRLASIEEDAEELSSLISELLAFTKANSSAVNSESIPLADFFGDLTARELEGHEVEIAVAETISAKADRKLLARAVQNVLRNCHRHAGADCKVRISAASAADTVSIVVEDNGPGAPEGELAKLFEPFYRPDKSRTRDTGGTGLGMAIVESSVRACGGKVSAEKSPMGGLLVRIILPKA
jgi:two-component system sensor histidine kinase CpxA